MARKTRLEYAGASYHVLNRGNYRRDLFAETGAARAFTRCLAEAAERFGWRVHAFVVMRNHFHLALETPEPNLSDGMKWLQGTWATRFNRFRRETGRPFQGRYKAWHVEPGPALAQVAHYIHLNPVRAKLVTPERLLDFRWSSLPLLAAGHRPPWLVAHIILHESGALADSAAGWRCYLSYLRNLAETDILERGEQFAEMCKGWAFGSADFKAELQARLARADRADARLEIVGAYREAHREVRAAIWEDKLQLAAAALHLSLDSLPATKSSADKVQLAALLKKTTSVSNLWLARRLHMGQASSVSQFVGRFRRAGGTETKEFKSALSRVAT